MPWDCGQQIHKDESKDFNQCAIREEGDDRGEHSRAPRGEAEFQRCRVNVPTLMTQLSSAQLSSVQGSSTQQHRDQRSLAAALSDLGRTEELRSTDEFQSFYFP